MRPTQRALESINAATPSAGAEQPEPPTREEQAAEIAAATMTQEAPADVVDAADARARLREIQTPGGIVAFADVRIDSDPAGATVTLVDRGQQAFLGTTPLSTSVDAAREYDVIVALDGHPTQMVHLDPTSTQRLDVTLGRKGATEGARPASSRDRDRDARTATSDSAKAAVAEPVVASKTRSVKAAKSDESKADKAVKADNAVEADNKAGKAAKAERADDKAETQASAAGATGTLMVSSKPPCEIIIDGKPTGLTTPQRSIELKAGTHKITFVNQSMGIKKTMRITIKAGEPTKLLQNLM